AQLAAAPAIMPSMALMEGVWARIDAEHAAEHAMPVTAPMWQPLWGHAQHAWNVLRGQVPLVRRGIWVAAAATMALGLLLALVAGGQRAPGVILSLFAPVIAGVSTAFIYGPESDPSLELALATPTSPRMVLVSRLALVLGYDVALAFAASVVLVIARGGTIWAAAPLWLGPTLLLAGISLVLSLLVSAIVAVASSMGLFFAHLVTQSQASGRIAPGAESPLIALWQTNPTILLLAMALLILAVLYVPRQQLAEG
ncbi:MAG: hypothetical protein IVW57_19130, partial [Ktedonobacterales bacterium]|nr:hypothetical protein [Ktedonobacterales bacterium]